MSPNDKVLVINCGSSSIKYQLLAMRDEQALAGGLLERIGEKDSRLRHWARDGRGGRAETLGEVIAKDHEQAMERIDAALTASNLFRAGERLAAIGHRVVHGGQDFCTPTLIDGAVIESIRALNSLAPLHNPANLIGIEICREAFPEVPQVAVFDTAFHHTMPPHAFRYAVPEDWFGRHGVRRYGFHGASHRYVATRAAQYLNRPLQAMSLITLHLGNGASACAIQNGRCIDTSMGFTPLEGLVMGTRCGDLDPAIPLYMQQATGAAAGTIDDRLNHASGLLGLCGANDLREVLAREAAGDGRARLALEIYCYRIKKYIGAYFAALGGIDALVFTGGVGENAALVRKMACEGLERLGIAIDENLNGAALGEIGDLGQAQMASRVLVVRTNEELQIARESFSVVFGDEETTRAPEREGAFVTDQGLCSLNT